LFETSDQGGGGEFVEVAMAGTLLIDGVEVGPRFSSNPLGVQGDLTEVMYIMLKIL